MSALEVEPLLDETADEPADAFHVHDTATAEWAMRRVRKLRDDLAEQELYAEGVAAWIKRERTREQEKERWLVEQLEEYHRRLFAEDEKRKTVRLPSGELKARKLPDTVLVADPGEFCAAYDGTDLVRVTMAPNLNELKTAVLKRGQSFDGVEVVPGDVKFSVVVAVPDETTEGF